MPVTRPVTLAAAMPPAAPQPQPATTSSPRPAAPASHSRIAEVAAALDRIDDEQRARRVASSAQPDEARPSPSRAHAPPRRSAPPAEVREPVRHWVQLAHASDPDVLPREFDRLKEKAPKLFAGRVAWTASAKSTNRLLVGPFESEEAAQHFVDRLEKADLTALAWTNDAGQKVEKMTTR
jgi:hypothetical protein